MKKVTVGVLSLQGDFREHIQVLQKLNINAIPVRSSEDLNQIDGIIFPGGESTTMVLLLERFRMKEKLIQLVKKGLPVWGTCAGMILLAEKLEDDRPQPLQLMDIRVKRNAFGRQIDSFEESISIPTVSQDPFEIIFIRAPIITSVGKDVEVLGKLENGYIVAAQQKNMLATAFHPELTKDFRFHEYFVSMITDKS